MKKTILFPTDFSDNSTHAARYAGMLAKRLDANIVVLHTYAIPITTEFQVPYDILNFEDISKKSGDVQLGQFVKALIHNAELAPDSVSEKIEYGEAPAKIVEVANSIHADMIVMGTKGASNILDRWLGTNAQSVMKNADCPVWIIPSDCEINCPDKVVYFTDFEEDEVFAVQKVLDVVEPLGSYCQVIHINEFLDMDSHRQIRATVNSMKENFQSREVYIHNIDRNDDDLIDALESYLSDSKPDVLALEIHEQSLLNRLFEPSVTNHFVFGARLPLLTFKK